MRSPVFLGLLAFAALLAGCVVLEVQDFASPQGPPVAKSRSVAAAGGAAAPAPVADHAAAEVDAILARPLFEPSRRAPAAATVATDGATPTVPRLAGIVVSPAGRSAIFANAGRPLVLAEGDKVGGYLIQSIGADRIVLVSGGASHVIHPAFDPNMAKGAPAPATPVAGASAAPAFVAPALAVQAPASGPPGRIDLPGLHGRPLGLAAAPGGPAPADIPAFPSLAAPDPAVRVAK